MSNKKPSLLELVKVDEPDWTNPAILENVDDTPSASEQDDTQPLLFPLHHALMKKAPASLCLSLLSAFPQAAETKNVHERVLLHYAAENKAPLEVVTALLVSYPQAVEMKDKFERMPLHVAVANQAPVEVFSALLAAYPQAVTLSCEEEKLPLHLAAASKAPVEVVTALLTAYPKAAEAKNRYERLPLHYAAGRNAPVEVVSALLIAYPQAAEIQSGNGDPFNGGLALHVALASKAHVEVVTALLAAFPQAAGIKDENEWLPLHVAVSRKAPVEVVSALLAAFPQAAETKDRYGKYPVHLATLHRAPLEVVLALLDAFPQAAEMRDSRQRAPLHYAAESKASIEVFSALLVAFPQAVEMKDEKKKTPLHFAAANDAPLEVVAALLTAFPQAAGLKDENERLPLHFAAANSAPLEVVSALLAVFPQAAEMKDNNGRLPIHHAVESQAPVEILSAIVLHDLPIKPFETAPNLVDAISNSSHAFSWTFLIDAISEDAVQSKSLVSSVFEHVRHLRGACLALAHAKHEKSGNEAIAIAHEVARQVMYEYIFFCGRFELQEGPPVHRSATAVVMYALDHGVTKEYEAAYNEALKAHRTANNELPIDGFKTAMAFLNSNYFGSASVDRESAGPRTSVDAKAQALFDSFDKNHSLALSLEEFLLFSATHFGKSRKVAIKFMRNKDEWQREIDVRSKNVLDSRFVISPLANSPTPETFAKQVSGLPALSDGSSLAEYKFGLIMPAADRSLKEINEKERPDLQHIKTLMSELGQAIVHCHENGIVHCDLKQLNALRLDGTIRLIDMDASCVFSADQADPESSDHVGSKFSSGVLPPEMFYQLKAGEEEQYRSYFGNICNASLDDPSQRASAELWKKIAPRKVKSGRSVKAVVVKTFYTRAVPDEDKGGTYDAAITDGLPYALQLVRASPTFDIWSFGCMLYRLVVGSSLFAVDDKDDDLKTADEMLRVLSITDAQLDTEINKMGVSGNEAPLVKDLLRKVLRVKPSDRLQSMGEVLDHGFFTGGLEDAIKDMRSMLRESQMQLTRIEEITEKTLESTVELKRMSLKQLRQLQKTERVLLNAAVEGVDITCPSCSIIVNAPFLPRGFDEGDADDWRAIKEGSAASRLNFMNALVDKKYNDGTVAVSSRFNAAREMVLKKMGLDDINGTCFYWYLVDEVTMEPLIPEVCEHVTREKFTGHCDKCNYPVKLYVKDEKWKETHKLLETAVPLMQLTLKAAKVANVVSGMARMIGYPAPSIPAEYMARADAAVGQLSKKSSIEDYAVLDSRLRAAASGEAATEDQVLAARGAALEELRKFLNEHGIGVDGDYMGLRRVATSGSGKVIWTTKENVKRIEEDAEREDEQSTVVEQLELELKLKIEQIERRERRPTSIEGGALFSTSGSREVLSSRNVGQSKDVGELRMSDLAIQTEHQETDNAASFRPEENLAALLIERGEWDEVEKLYKSVIAGRLKLVGPEHASTLAAEETLASLLADRGKLAEARALYRSIVERQNIVFGPEHNETLSTEENLAILLDDSGDWEEAKKLFKSVIARRTITVGPDHADTLATEGNLAALLTDRGDWAEANGLYASVLTRMKKLLGPDHPDTLLTEGNLAELLMQEGDLEGAKTIMMHVFESQVRVHGSDHENARYTMENIAKLSRREKGLDGSSEGGAKRLEEQGQGRDQASEIGASFVPVDLTEKFGYKTVLLHFYQRHNPSKTSMIDMIMNDYHNEEEELFMQLFEKYTLGPDEWVELRSSLEQGHDATDSSPQSDTSLTSFAPSSLPPLDDSSGPVRKSGWLEKKNRNGRKSMAKRFFTLVARHEVHQTPVLLYDRSAYASEQSKKKGAILLEGCTVVDTAAAPSPAGGRRKSGWGAEEALAASPSQSKGGWTFELRHPTRETRVLKAPDQAGHIEWVAALTEVLFEYEAENEALDKIDPQRAERRRHNIALADATSREEEN